MYSFPNLEPVCPMSSSNSCFLTFIQISQEADKVVWYFHLFKNFSQFVMIHKVKGFQFSSVQLLSHVWLFVTPWTIAHQASLSITNSRSLPKLMSLDSVRPSNHLIFCRPLLLLPSIFPNIRVFSKESALASGGQSIGLSASTSVLPMTIQD